ncbi:hypothetical protein [Gracilibacillus sp. YIM 98692]|uniref:hypothetical protein n=1 Tax=Gracilibacillus sp. YIM 98692 TaxID=2663532 RepID=UPI0013D194A4|nr:hypothetical protein [Gracilibacillus sp. YIM 98692]
MRHQKIQMIILVLFMLIGCSNETKSVDESTEKQIDQSMTEEKFIKETYNIKTESFNVAQPDIYSDTVVWAGKNERKQKGIERLDSIFVYDNSEKENKQLFKTQLKGQTDETQINENWICWVDWSDEYASNWVIYGYSRKDDELIQIYSSNDSPSPDKGILPRLTLSDNDYLSWIEKVENENTIKNEVKLVHLPTKEIKAISDVNYGQSIAHISNNYLVWSSEKSIYIYSLQEEEIVETINTNQLVNFPKVNNDYVVWQELGSEGPSDSTLKIKQIDMDDKPIEVVFKGNMFFYDIGHDYLVWQTGEEIRAYSIKTKETKSLGDGFLPYIRGNKVVWEQGEEDDYVIFKVAELQ